MVLLAGSALIQNTAQLSCRFKFTLVSNLFISAITNSSSSSLV